MNRYRRLWIISLLPVVACGNQSQSAPAPGVDDNQAPEPAFIAPTPTKSVKAEPGTGSIPADRPATPGVLAIDTGEHRGEYQWSARIGGVGRDSVRGVAWDKAGNLAITGYFSDSVAFGGSTARKAANIDTYVSKYGPDGAHLWTATFGGKGEDVGNGIAIDEDGYITVVGLFSDVMEVGTTPLKSAGSDDIFIVRLTPEGDIAWARRVGGTDSDAAHDVVTGKSGDIVVTGSFKKSMQVGKDTIASQGNEDIFVLKLDSDGYLEWIVRHGGRYRDFGQQVEMTGDGGVVLLAEFTDDVSFGGEVLKNQGNRDLALVAMNPDGSHRWSKSFGSPFNELGLGLAVDPAGNIVLTGSFDNEITFGGDVFKSQGESDIYVAKFDASGGHLWSKAYGAAREDIGHSVAVDTFGNIVVGGWFWHSVDFGGGELESTSGNKDAFLLKLSESGEHLWSKRLGDRDHDQIRGVAIHHSGRIAAAGIFRFSLQFAGESLESARKPQDKAPPADAFVAVFTR